MSKFRNWCFTINNYLEHEWQAFEALDEQDMYTYLVVGREVGESGTPHLQGFIYFKNPRSLPGIKKLGLFKRAHLENAKGSNKQASDYCKKENNFIEKGVLPNNGGKRTDLEAAYKMVNEGSSVDEVALSMPDVYNRAHKVLHKLEDIRLRSLRRDFMTEGEWIYGPTGVGKSEYSFSHENSYVFPYDNGWWDGYACQDVVVIDEFRGQLAFNELLRMVDKHPNYYVRRRNREPMPFVSKKVIITSSMAPWEVFAKLDTSDSLKQLYRRFKIYKIDKNGLQLVDSPQEAAYASS